MLELYILETCPYCKKVIDFMENNNIKFIRRLISDDVNLSNLILIGGKEQVPFLFNFETNAGLYESEDIIDYLRQVINDEQ